MNVNQRSKFYLKFYLIFLTNFLLFSFFLQNERFIVNGSHDATKLQDLLDGFIRKYVLCPECDNPETDLIVSSKKQTISQGCKACGFHGPLEVHHKVGQTERKTKFVVNNQATV